MLPSASSQVGPVCDMRSSASLSVHDFGLSYRAIRMLAAGFGEFDGLRGRTVEAQLLANLNTLADKPDARLAVEALGQHLEREVARRRG